MFSGISPEASSLNKRPRIRSGLDGSSLKLGVYVGGDASREILLRSGCAFGKGDGTMALVFLDLDGTLLDTGVPSASTLAAIARLKANGHEPIIASGRTPHLLYGIDRILGIESAITANGNYINYRGETIYERYVPERVVTKMAQLSDEMGFDVVFEGVDAYVAYSRKGEKVDQFSRTFNLEIPVLNRTYHLHNPLLAFIVFDDHVVDHLRETFPELVFSPSSRFGYDVNLRGDLKAEGVRWLIKYLQYPEDQVYAIGDGANDISMIKTVAHGIAMGNGFPELKAVASYVTTSVQEDGVPNALKHFGLI